MTGVALLFCLTLTFPLNPRLKHSLFSIQTNLSDLLFWIFIALLLYLRVWICLHINFKLVDSDQMYMWLGAKDFSEGHFYEARYYGQNYNTFMEALFAVPLLWTGLSVYKALPVATLFISLFPWLFTAGYLYYNKRKVNALITLAVLLSMPAQFDLTNSLSRGFVTGLFFCSFYVINIINPRNIHAYLINAVLSVIAWFVNPTSVFVSAPFLLYLFLHNFRTRSCYLASLPALLLLWPLHLLFDRLYILHPEYIMHPMVDNFSTDYFWESIQTLDLKFGYISPFFENRSVSLIVALLILGALFWRFDRKALVCLGLLVAITLFSFIYEKSCEGTEWAYMPWSRMYLGIPFFIGLFQGRISLKIRTGFLLFFLLPLLYQANKCISPYRHFEKNFRPEKFVGIHILPVERVTDATSFYKKKCLENNAGILLVSNEFWLHNELVYGGPALDKNYPPTEEVRLEKRFWVRNANRDKVFKRILLISVLSTLDKLIPPNAGFRLKKLDDYGMFLVYDNQLTMKELIREIRRVEYKGKHLEEE
jgi:hypothetical protein